MAEATGANAIAYARLAWLKLGASANLAADAQMWGGVAESLPTSPITAVNDDNQRIAGPDIPNRVLSLVFFVTPTILAFFRGDKGTVYGAANRFGGILGTEVDVEIQYLHELGSGMAGEASATAPVGHFEKCYVDSPGQFPGGDTNTPMLLAVNWTVNGPAYWQGVA